MYIYNVKYSYILYFILCNIYVKEIVKQFYFYVNLQKINCKLKMSTFDIIQ